MLRVLTSSLVVRLEATRYVWKPERPKMDQTEKKHITSSTAVKVWVKENQEAGDEADSSMHWLHIKIHLKKDLKTVQLLFSLFPWHSARKI